MTPRADGDYGGFVEARWPDLEPVALVATLDPRAARELTTRVLADLGAHWERTLADGAPTTTARRGLLDAIGGWGHSRTTPAAPDPAVQTAVEDADGTVPPALLDALAREEPLVRAAVVVPIAWALDEDAAVALAGRHGAALARALPGARSRLAAVQAAAGTTEGAGPAGAHLREDLTDLVDRLTTVLPPAPGADTLTSAAEVPSIRRRLLLLLAGAAVATVAGRRLYDLSTESSSTRGTLALPADSDAWLAVRTWPARGALATDGEVGDLVARAPGPEAARMLFADDVHGTRVVVAAAPGTDWYPEHTLRVWAGRAGGRVEGLVELPLDQPRVDHFSDVVPVALAHADGYLLLVLARPTVEVAEFSPVVRLTAGGTIDRPSTPVALTDGVGSTLLAARPTASARVTCERWYSSVVLPAAWVDTVDQNDPGERLAALVAARTGFERASLTTEVVRSRLGRRGADLLGAPASATAWLTLVRTPDGAVVRDFTVGGLRQDDEGLWDVRPVLVPASEAQSPATLVVREDVETSIVLVSAPEGAATVRIVGFGPYEGFSSATTPVTDRVAVVEAPHPVSFPPGMAVVVRDAAGRTLFDGEPPAGTDLLDP